MSYGLVPLPGLSVSGLATQWRAWGDFGRNELAKEFAESNNNETKLTEETRRWLTRFNELAIGVAEVVKGIEAKVEPIRTEFDNATARIAAWGEWLVPMNINLLDWIGVRSQRDSLLKAIAILRQIPPTPLSIDVGGDAESVVKKMLSRFRAADETFEEPKNWKPVKGKLIQTLAAIVNEHLPRTLEKLWRELALN